LFFKPSHSINAGGISHEWLGLNNYCYDKSFAPAGKSVIAASMLSADYDWWRQKYQDKEAYKAEKERVAAEVCAAIEERYPKPEEKLNRLT